MSDSAVSFTDLLRAQIRHGLTAAQQYLAAAVYFDSYRLPRLAEHCYARSGGHRGHALRMVQYLLDRSVEVRVGGLDEVRSEFDSPRAAVAFLLEAERTCATQVATLIRSARDSLDHLGEGFVQWFLREQQDHVTRLTSLLVVLDRAEGDLLDVEEFIAREAGPARADSAVPKMAGAADK